MAKVVRSSKFRHVAGTPAPSDEIQRGVRIGSISPDANLLKANARFAAFPWPVPNSIIVIPNNKKGAIEDEHPVIVQEVPVVEFALDPFNECALLTAGQDGAARVFTWGADGLAGNVDQPAAVMQHGDKRLVLADYHPFAQNVALTAAGDYSVKLWDTSRPDAAQLELPAAHKGLLSSVSWNRGGALLATTAKDKKLRTFDARANAVIAEVADHDGAKASRVLWYGAADQILTFGFTKTQERAINIYDARNLTAKLATMKLDASSAGFLPFIDEDNALLYLGGKGEGTIRVYEFEGTALHPCSEFKSATSTSGLAMLPKRCCNKAKNEVARFLKMTTDTIVPIRFDVARQGTAGFQDDLYPPTWDCRPVADAADWFGGANRELNLVAQSPDS